MSWLDEYQPLIGVRLNMVATVEGKYVGTSGSSRDISNDVDRSLISRLRQICDVYVTGGNTFRSEGYKAPMKKSLAVITRYKEDLPDGVIGITPGTSDIVLGSIAKLHDFGFERILLEVGPSLATLFLSADCVDEFCLTIPEGKFEDASRVAKSLGSQLTLIDQIQIEGTLFTRWRRGND